MPCGMEKLDLKDPDIARAIGIGMAAARASGTPDPDFEYAQNDLRLAQDVYKSDVFKGTPDHIAAQEKKVIAQVFLAWPALHDVIRQGRELQLIEELGPVPAAIALEICRIEDMADLASPNFSALAKKARRIEMNFHAEALRLLPKNVSAIEIQPGAPKQH